MQASPAPVMREQAIGRWERLPGHSMVAKLHFLLVAERAFVLQLFSN
jgi:hypothetical protein